MTSARIMHIDDEPHIREVVRMSLELDRETTVLSCATGTEALAVVGDWQPDVILLDVMMPNMDGPTTLERLRQHPGAASIPVVFMTARVQSRELEYFKSLGAADVLGKPFDPVTLAATLRKFMRSEVLSPDVVASEFLAGARGSATKIADVVVGSVEPRVSP